MNEYTHPTSEFQPQTYHTDLAAKRKSVGGCCAATASYAPSLPCHNGNNSIENSKIWTDLPLSVRKRLFAANENIKNFINRYGENNCGMWTITSKEKLTPREFSRRFNSLNTNIIKKDARIIDYIRIAEYSESGRLHYHLLVALSQDIKTGLNFDELKERKYSSASPYLRQFWKDYRILLPKYGLGRAELLPIRKTGSHVAAYLCKYLIKSLHYKNETKGTRLISYSRKSANTIQNFTFHTDRSKLYRKQLAKFANFADCKNLAEMTMAFGRNWAHNINWAVDLVDDLPPATIHKLISILSSDKYSTDFLLKKCSPSHPILVLKDSIRLIDSHLVDLDTGRILY